MNNEQRTVNSQQLFSCLRLITAVLLLLTVHCSLLTARGGTTPEQQRLAVFDDVWETIRERYYDANLRGVNWEQQRRDYRLQAARAGGEKEFYKVLRQMVGVLRDSHTRVFAPDEKFDWRKPRIVSVGLTVREVETELIITKVESDSIAERAGVRIGDVLTSVDSVSAKEIFARRSGEQTGSSTTGIARLRAVSGIFEGVVDSVVNVGFRDAAGKNHFVFLRREWKDVPTSIRAKREGSTLIIGFDSFAPEIVREFFQILRTDLRGVRGIVLDLRANRGGSAEAMTDIASAFLPENQAIGKFIDRTGKVEVESNTRRWLLYTASAVKVPNLPIVVLTSTATASAAEIFTAALKQQNRAITIGAATCGCVLAIKRQHTLPDGGVLEISELDFQMPGGARLEGVGIVPDEAFAATRKDLIANRDRPLERALQLTKN